MRTTEALEKIRLVWLSRASHRLARGEGVRESFVGQLDQFYNLLLQVVETGDPAWLGPILEEWTQTRTATDLKNREQSLQEILSNIMLEGFETARELLDNREALELTSSLLPVFAYAFQFISRMEARLQVDYISAELKSAQETLERLDRSKSDFIAIAAHELKTPLTLIEGYTTMLQEHLSHEDPSSHESVLLRGIHKGTQRLREIVDDMIDVSMIDNRLLSLNFQPIWINRLLSVIEEEATGAVRERHQALTVTKIQGCDEVMFGDAERLYQAFRNLLSNAIKYTPDGGSITVDGRMLPGFVEVRVADTGIGIDPEDQVIIFEKFGRLGNISTHSSGKTKFKGGGPGLGLPITKGIIEAHGGAIWVESEGYDEARCPGTTFHVLLPFRKELPDHKLARLFGGLTDAQDSESSASQATPA